MGHLKLGLPRKIFAQEYYKSTSSSFALTILLIVTSYTFETYKSWACRMNFLKSSRLCKLVKTNCVDTLGSITLNSMYAEINPVPFSLKLLTQQFPNL